jgi:hypothetical protein
MTGYPVNRKMLVILPTLWDRVESMYPTEVISSAHFETRGGGVLCSRLRPGWRVDIQAYNFANRFYSKTGEASGRKT